MLSNLQSWIYSATKQVPDWFKMSECLGDFLLLLLLLYSPWAHEIAHVRVPLPGSTD